MNDTYIDPKWEKALVDAGLTDFEAMWNVSLETVDDTNVRRGGWSQAYIMPLRLDGGKAIRTIVKRHMNHSTRTIAHPVIGIPTLRREFHNIQQCHRFNIPTVEAVYYAERHEPGKRRAILVTEYLEGYVSLHDLVLQWRRQGWPDPSERRPVIEAVARCIRQLHRHKLQHGHLQPKHILLRSDHGEVDARLIDLECMRATPTRRRCRVRDLTTLYRHLRSCSNPDRLRFALAYAQTQRLDARTRRLCHQVLARTRRKEAHHRSKSPLRRTR